MNNTMAKNTNLSTTETKKLSKQEDQRHNHGYRERFVGCQMRGGCGGMGEEVSRLISTNR